MAEIMQIVVISKKRIKQVPNNHSPGRQLKAQNFTGDIIDITIVGNPESMKTLSGKICKP